jgi:glycerophosphoryl diester phosphodiesterase
VSAKRRFRRFALGIAVICGLVALSGVVTALLPPTDASNAPGTLIRPAQANGGPAHRPLIIAHRGASAYRPEETIGAYQLAVEQGADYLEADLVATKDGVLVARHENELSSTTDVAAHPEFAALRRRKTIEGGHWIGWFTEDFTLAELRTLGARERYPARRPGSASYDGRYPVATLTDLIDLVRTDEARYHRRIGLYLETKFPAYFASIGLALEPLLARALHAGRLDRPGSPVFLESFEGASLSRLHNLLPLPTIQLISPGAPVPLDAIERFATGIGVDPSHVPAGGALIAQAHRKGLLVHLYLLNGAQLIPAQYAAYRDAGVDGFFVDDPDETLAALTSAGGG